MSLHEVRSLEIDNSSSGKPGTQGMASFYVGNTLEEGSGPKEEKTWERLQRKMSERMPPTSERETTGPTDAPGKGSSAFKEAVSKAALWETRKDEAKTALLGVLLEERVTATTFPDANLILSYDSSFRNNLEKNPDFQGHLQELVEAGENANLARVAREGAIRHSDYVEDRHRLRDSFDGGLVWPAEEAVEIVWKKLADAIQERGNERIADIRTMTPEAKEAQLQNIKGALCEKWKPAYDKISQDAHKIEEKWDLINEKLEQEANKLRKKWLQNSQKRRQGYTALNQKWISAYEEKRQASAANATEWQRISGPDRQESATLRAQWAQIQ